jgi:hypothetical protein
MPSRTLHEDAPILGGLSAIGKLTSGLLVVRQDALS